MSHSWLKYASYALKIKSKILNMTSKVPEDTTYDNLTSSLTNLPHHQPQPAWHTCSTFQPNQATCTSQMCCTLSYPRDFVYPISISWNPFLPSPSTSFCRTHPYSSWINLAIIWKVISDSQGWFRIHLVCIPGSLSFYYRTDHHQLALLCLSQ